MKYVIIFVVALCIFTSTADAKTPKKHHSGPTLAQQVQAMKKTIATLSTKLAQVNAMAMTARTTAENAANTVICIVGAKWVAVDDNNNLIGSDGTEATAFLVAQIAPQCIK